MELKTKYNIGDEVYYISYATVQGRIKNGWNIIRAIQTPSRHIRRKII